MAGAGNGRGQGRHFGSRASEHSSPLQPAGRLSQRHCRVRGLCAHRAGPDTQPPPCVAPRPSAPSPAASSRSPSPFPHVWMTSKFREKASWWLPERRRDSAAQRPPPRAPGGGRGTPKARSFSSRGAGPSGRWEPDAPHPKSYWKIHFYKANAFPELFSAS